MMLQILPILLFAGVFGSGMCFLHWKCQPGGPKNNIITEDHIKKTCTSPGGYRSRYYKENWGYSIYYTDEKIFLYREAPRSPTAVTGTVSSIYRQNRTERVFMDNSNCTITQPLFVMAISTSCVLIDPNYNAPLPNPMRIIYQCPPTGFKEGDKVILTVGSLSHNCWQQGSEGPCITQKWGYGQLAFYRYNKDTLTKLMRICGYQNPNGDNCPQVVVTAKTCSRSNTNMASLIALLVTLATSMLLITSS